MIKEEKIREEKCYYNADGGQEVHPKGYIIEDKKTNEKTIPKSTVHSLLVYVVLQRCSLRSSPGKSHYFSNPSGYGLSTWKGSVRPRHFMQIQIDLWTTLLVWKILAIVITWKWNLVILMHFSIFCRLVAYLALCNVIA